MEAKGYFTKICVGLIIFLSISCAPGFKATTNNDNDASSTLDIDSTGQVNINPQATAPQSISMKFVGTGKTLWSHELTLINGVFSIKSSSFNEAHLDKSVSFSPRTLNTATNNCVSSFKIARLNSQIQYQAEMAYCADNANQIRVQHRTRTSTIGTTKWTDFGAWTVHQNNYFPPGTPSSVSTIQSMYYTGEGGTEWKHHVSLINGNFTVNSASYNKNHLDKQVNYGKYILKTASKNCVSGMRVARFDNKIEYRTELAFCTEKPNQIRIQHRAQTRAIGTTAWTAWSTFNIQYNRQFAANNSGPDIQFEHDFNTDRLGAYTLDDLLKYWDYSGKSPTVVAGNVKIVKKAGDASDRFTRVFYGANTYGRTNGGAKWNMKFPGREQLFLAYDVRFRKGAEFVKGGKLPRLQSTGWQGDPGVRPDGTDRWTAALMWRENGKMTSYIYHADQKGDYGDTRNWDDGVNGQVYFKPGQWHNIEVRVIMNVPGKANGIMQGWFDGKFAFSINNIMWRVKGGEHLTIGQFEFVTFYGGAGADWAPTADQYVDFDNFVISTKPISH